MPENGVAPERVSVPVCAPVARVSVAVVFALLFKATVPPTLTEPEPRAKEALIVLRAVSCEPVTVRPPEIDIVETVDVKAAVTL